MMIQQLPDYKRLQYERGRDALSCEKYINTVLEDMEKEIIQDLYSKDVDLELVKTKTFAMQYLKQAIETDIMRYQDIVRSLSQH